MTALGGVDIIQVRVKAELDRFIRLPDAPERGRPQLHRAADASSAARR